MNTVSIYVLRFLSLLCLTVWAAEPRAVAQIPAELDIHLYAGLTITGAVGTVYSVEYVTDLVQTNTPSAWRCLEFLQLPGTPICGLISRLRRQRSGSIGRWQWEHRRAWYSSRQGRFGWEARRTKWTDWIGKVRRQT
jgi:hypothetical protein